MTNKVIVGGLALLLAVMTIVGGKVLSQTKDGKAAANPKELAIGKASAKEENKTVGKKVPEANVITMDEIKAAIKEGLSQVKGLTKEEVQAAIKEEVTAAIKSALPASAKGLTKEDVAGVLQSILDKEKRGKLAEDQAKASERVAQLQKLVDDRLKADLKEEKRRKVMNSFEFTELDRKIKREEERHNSAMDTAEELHNREISEIQDGDARRIVINKHEAWKNIRENGFRLRIKPLEEKRRKLLEGK